MSTSRKLVVADHLLGSDQPVCRVYAVLDGQNAVPERPRPRPTRQAAAEGEQKRQLVEYSSWWMRLAGLFHDGPLAPAFDYQPGVALDDGAIWVCRSERICCEFTVMTGSFSARMGPAGARHAAALSTQELC